MRAEQPEATEPPAPVDAEQQPEEHPHQPDAPSEPAEDTAPATGSATATPGRKPLTTAQKWLVGVVLAGVILIAAIGFAASYQAVAQLAEEKGFGRLAKLVPIGLDAGIVVFYALDLLLTWLRIHFLALRPAAWVLTVATITFNGATSWPDPIGVGLHTCMPLIFILAVEAARHAVKRLAELDSGHDYTYPPLRMWLVAPLPTFRIWRYQTRHSIPSYHDVLNQQRDRRVYRATMRHQHGWKWRKNPELLVPLRLARHGIPLEEARRLPAREREAAADAAHEASMQQERRHTERQAEQGRQARELAREQEEEAARRDEAARQQRLAQERERTETARLRAEQQAAEEEAARRSRIDAEREKAETARLRAQQETSAAEAAHTRRLLAAREEAERQRLADENAAAHQLAEEKARAERQRLAAQAHAEQNEHEQRARVSQAKAQREIDRLNAERRREEKAAAEEAERERRAEQQRLARQLLHEPNPGRTTATPDPNHSPAPANLGEPTAEPNRTAAEPEANRQNPTANPRRTEHAEPTNQPTPGAEPNHGAPNPTRTEPAPAANLESDRTTAPNPETEPANRTKSTQVLHLLNLITKRGYKAITLAVAQQELHLKSKSAASPHLRAARIAWGAEQVVSLMQDHGDQAGPEQLIQLGMREDLAHAAWESGRSLWDQLTSSGSPAEPNQ